MILKLNQRSNSKELIDSKDVPADEIIRNLKELDVFNRLTGSIWFTILQLRKLKLLPGKHYHLVDLGCGGGEFILQAAGWASKNGIDMTFSGVDNNPTVIDYFKKRTKHIQQIRGYNADYRTFLNETDQKIDIIHCALFTHHLDENEIFSLLTVANKLKSVLLINDLQRSIVAYYGAIAITRLFNGTSLAKHDGPLSVLRGFKKHEIVNLANRAGMNVKYAGSILFFRFLFVIIPKYD